MTKPTSTKPATIGNDSLKIAADIVVADDRAIVKRTGGKVSEEQYQDALERLAAGDTMRNVTNRLGLSRSALLVRAREDENFRRTLDVAQEMGTWARLETAEDMLMGGELSTQSIERDKAVMDYAKWYATKINRAKFGDKLQIDQRSITIQIKQDDTEW